MSKYRKTITALVTGIVGWGTVVVASAPHGVTGAEWLTLGVVAATSLGVYSVANGPAAP